MASRAKLDYQRSGPEFWLPIRCGVVLPTGMNAIDPDRGVGRVSHPLHADWLPAALALGLKDPGWGYERRKHCRSKRPVTMRMPSMLDVIAVVPGQFSTRGMGSMSRSSLPSGSMTGIAMSVALERRSLEQGEDRRKAAAPSEARLVNPNQAPGSKAVCAIWRCQRRHRQQTARLRRRSLESR